MPVTRSQKGTARRPVQDQETVPEQETIEDSTPTNTWSPGEPTEMMTDPATTDPLPLPLQEGKEPAGETIPPLAEGGRAGASSKHSRAKSERRKKQADLEIEIMRARLAARRDEIRLKEAELARFNQDTDEDSDDGTIVSVSHHRRVSDWIDTQQHIEDGGATEHQDGLPREAGALRSPIPPTAPRTGAEQLVDGQGAAAIHRGGLPREAGALRSPILQSAPHMGAEHRIGRANQLEGVVTTDGLPREAGALRPPILQSAPHMGAEYSTGRANQREGVVITDGLPREAGALRPPILQSAPHMGAEYRTGRANQPEGVVKTEDGLPREAGALRPPILQSAPHMGAEFKIDSWTTEHRRYDAKLRAQEVNYSYGDGLPRASEMRPPIPTQTLSRGAEQVGSPTPQAAGLQALSATTPAGGTKPLEGQSPLRSELSELASAIVIAARAGSQSAVRHFIELPYYGGSHQEWLSFRAAYMESATAYTPAENTARLRRSLKGKAKEAVESLLLHSNQPDVIMRALQSRFGRPDVIATAELDRLRALPRVTDSPTDICIFASKVINIVAAVRAIGKSNYLAGPGLMNECEDKLTNTLKYRWYDYIRDQKGDADLDQFARFLDREAATVEHRAKPEPSQDTAAWRTIQKRPQKAFTTTQHDPQPECKACQGRDHGTTACKKYLQMNSDERWELAKSKSLCFRCLRRRTSSHRCKKTQCGTDGCQRLHHKTLHFKKEAEKSEIVTSTWGAPVDTHAFLKMVPVTISGPRGKVNTHALLDDGSTVTLVDADIIQQLGVKGRLYPLRIQGIADSKVKEDRSRVVTLNLQGTSNRSVNINAHSIEAIKLGSQTVSEAVIDGCPHLADIKEQLIYRKAEPKILIGQDNWELLTSTETRQGSSNQPVASLTPLGWVLHGFTTRSLGHRVHYVNRTTRVEEDMDEQLKEFFKIESLSIEPRRPTTDPEQRAISLLQQHTRDIGGQYETALLWKSEDIRMPNNRGMAMRRLEHTERRLDKDPELKAKYIEQMENLMSKGYAEKAPPVTTENKTWYLPHFPVLNPMKPGKVRVVHDAAAKVGSTSLNSNLLKGPDLLQSLPGVLMRLRQHPIAVSADIAEMFMQVKIRSQDRDALRYLWRGDSRGDTEATEYRMTSLIFGATSSPASAIYVKNFNAERYRKTHPEAYDAIVNHHYVDDYLQSFRTLDEAVKTVSEVQKIQREAHYDLRQWTSNEPRLLEQIGQLNGQQTTVDLSSSEAGERVLGLRWKPTTDVIAFNLDLKRLPQDILEKTRPTKREVLKIIMSLFDPLGLAAIVTAPAKQLLQEVWRRGTDWDQPIDNDLADRWTNWLIHLHQLRSIEIPRCYSGYSIAKNLQLHIFVDASETSYATSLYWRTEDEDGAVAVTLVTAKARVAPLKLTSIPRLELQAAVIGSRMAAAVIKAHDRQPDSRHYWTDSKTVLCWLRAGSRSFKPFVAHRIAAIEEHTKVNEWRWVPTKQNVADDSTRDVPDDLDSIHRWYRGPQFLYEEPSKWPQETANTVKITDTGEEKVKTITRAPTEATSLPDYKRFSRWERLVRSTARVLQFIALCRRTTKPVHYKRTMKNTEKDPTWSKQNKTKKYPVKTEYRQTENTTFVPLTAAHLKKAEELLVRAVQQSSFGEELRCLRSERPISASSRLNKLAVQLTDGVITLKTRIGAAEDIPETVRIPAVMDGNHYISKLFFDYIHRKLHHAGTETTVNECRQHYWFIRLRPNIKMIVQSCRPCRIRRATPASPPTGDHPKGRLAHHRRPFTHVGLDYFGPLTVTVGRSTQKRYVALFTCLTTRAVHLEVAGSLSTDSAVMALRRMMARRGTPTEIWSDNGTNLHGCDRELRAAMDAATQEEASKQKIEWRYIPPSAPFMGGAWERLVRSTKVALTAVLHERHPTEEVLRTVIAEAEYTVNSRPLTHVTTDENHPEALTPNHFLMGGSGLVTAPGTFTETDLIGRTHWRASQLLADQFWSRWVREYLPELQHRREPHGRGQLLQIGDVVLIADGTLPRNTWPRGIIIAVYPGADGVVRAVDVRTSGGVLRRPTKKLVLLPTEPTSSPAPESTCPIDQSTYTRREYVQDKNSS